MNTKRIAGVSRGHAAGTKYLNRRVPTPLWVFVLISIFIIAVTIQSILVVGVLNGNIDSIIYSNEMQQHLRRPSRRLTDGDITKSSGAGPILDDTTNVPIPKHRDGTPLGVEERLRYLELKANAYLNFGSDPFFGSTIQSQCSNATDLRPYGCIPGADGYKDGVPMQKNCPGFYDHFICLDHLPDGHIPVQDRDIPGVEEPPDNNLRTQRKTKQQEAPCLVYDFGIRDMPTFGAAMAKSFGCEVHAFDPSPVSIEWWASARAKPLRDLPNYFFHPYGAGGIDGDLTLNEYDWGQVSIIRYPDHMVDCSKYDSSKKGQGQGCKLKTTGGQKTFTLPVKTLPTIIKELGHEGRTIDVMKVDVEGSEFAFLENMFDGTGGCPDFIEQLAIEWHHMPWDARYGEGSSPSINAIVTLLHTCGLKMFWQHSPGGWRSPEKIFVDLDMKDVRYNLASFHREREAMQVHAISRNS